MNGSTPLSEAFAVLGLEPTLDALSVKRAYFAAVAQTPPYRDALAFGRIRGAYEALMQPGGLEAAYLLAPLDATRETAGLRDRYGSAPAEARQRIASQHAAEQKVQTFVAAATTTLSAFPRKRRAPLSHARAPVGCPRRFSALERLTGRECPESKATSQRLDRVKTTRPAVPRDTDPGHELNWG